MNIATKAMTQMEFGDQLAYARRRILIFLGLVETDHSKASTSHMLKGHRQLPSKKDKRLGSVLNRQTQALVERAGQGGSTLEIFCGIINL